jgi:hypothetical protein
MKFVQGVNALFEEKKKRLEASDFYNNVLYRKGFYAFRLNRKIVRLQMINLNVRTVTKRDC